MPETQGAQPTPGPHRSLYRKGRMVFGYTLRSLLHSTPLDFDRGHGVDTRDSVGLDALLSAPIHDAHGRSRYAPIPVKHFGFAMAQVPRPLSDWSFVDLGSGKGRAVLLAMGLPFRRVVGVELDPSLSAIAQTNVRRYRGPRRCEAVDLRVEDATVAALPPGDVVAFLYNSFIGTALERFLDHVEQSLRASPRRFLLVYSHPMDRATVERHPAFHLFFEGHSPLDPLWRGCRHVAIYRCAGAPTSDGPLRAG